jgi:poly(3-hydroxybutyrate) depolymerase
MMASSGELQRCAFGGFEHAVTFMPPRYSERSDWPLLLYLHGASTRGDMQRLASSHGGFVRHLHPGAALAALPMVVVAPLCPIGTEWAVPEMCDRLHRFVDAALVSFNVAPTALFVTGNSMGGLGCYMMVVRDKDPERWAGAVPICGGGHPVFARLAAPVPWWFFHAVPDKVVAVEDTDKLVEALHQAGAADVRYTRFAEAPDPDVEVRLPPAQLFTPANPTNKLATWMTDGSIAAAALQHSGLGEALHCFELLMIIEAFFLALGPFSAGLLRRSQRVG